MIAEAKMGKSGDPVKPLSKSSETEERYRTLPFDAAEAASRTNGHYSISFTQNEKVPRQILDIAALPTIYKSREKSAKTSTVEDAIPLTGVGAFHWALLLVTGMCGASAVHEIVSPSYILTSASCDLEMDNETRSLLSGIVFIGMIAGTHMWGILSDRLGRILVLRLSLLMDAALSIVASLLPSAPLIIATRFINGVLIAAPPSCSLAYLGEFHAEKSRARALVLYGLFPGGATLSLAALAYLVLPLQVDVPLPWIAFRSWRLFVLLNSLPALLTGLALFWFPESPRYLVSSGRPDLALDVLRHMFAVNKRRPREEFPVAAIVGPTSPSTPAPHAEGRGPCCALLLSLWEQTVCLLRLQFLKITVISCALTFATLCIGNGLLVWVPELFNRMSQFSADHPNETATVCEAWQASGEPRVEDPASACQGVVLHDSMFVNTAIIGVANLVACVLGMFLVNLMGKRLLLCVSFVITGTLGFLLNLTPSILGLIAVTCGYIGIMTMCITLVISVFVDNVPTKVRGTAVSLAMTVGRGGSMCGSYVTGRLLDAHCGGWFWGLSGMCLVLGVLTFLLPKRGAYAK